MATKKILLGLLAGALLGTGWLAAQGRPVGGSGGAQQQRQQQPTPPQQQQAQAQQQMAGAQLGQQQRLQQMDQLRDRLRTLEHRADGLAGQMIRKQGGLGDQQRKRDQSMQLLCESMRDTTRDMLRSMDRLHQNLQDPLMTRDKDMDGDMDRLHDQMRLMTDQMEEALQTLDRLRLKIHQSQ